MEEHPVAEAEAESEALLVQAAADTLTWLAGIELLISEKQQEYANIMLQLQMEAAVSIEERDTDRIAQLRALARESLNEVRQLLGLLRNTLDQLPAHLHEPPDQLSSPTAISDVSVASGSRPIRPPTSSHMAEAEVAAASAFVERLPSVSHRVSTGAFPSDCPICLNTLEPEPKTRSAQIVALPCGNGSHCFHRHCIHEWVRLSACCPLCRKGLWSSSPCQLAEEKSEDVVVADAESQVPRAPVGWTAWASAPSPSLPSDQGPSCPGRRGQQAWANPSSGEGSNSRPPSQPAAARGDAAPERGSAAPAVADREPLSASLPSSATLKAKSGQIRSSSLTAASPTSVLKMEAAVQRGAGFQHNLFTIRPLSRSSSQGRTAADPAASDKVRGFVAKKLRSTPSMSAARGASSELSVAGQEIRPSSAAANRVGRKQQPWRVDSQPQLIQSRPGTAAGSLKIASDRAQIPTPALFPQLGHESAASGAVASNPLWAEAPPRQSTPATGRRQPVRPSTMTAQRRQPSRPGMPATLMGMSMPGRRQLLIGS